MALPKRRRSNFKKKTILPAKCTNAGFIRKRAGLVLKTRYTIYNGRYGIGTLFSSEDGLNDFDRRALLQSGTKLNPANAFVNKSSHSHNLLHHSRVPVHIPHMYQKRNARTLRLHRKWFKKKKKLYSRLAQHNLRVWWLIFRKGTRPGLTGFWRNKVRKNKILVRLHTNNFMDVGTCRTAAMEDPRQPKFATPYIEPRAIGNENSMLPKRPRGHVPRDEDWIKRLKEILFSSKEISL